LYQEVIHNTTSSSKQRSVLRTYAEYAVAWVILHALGALPRTFALKIGQAVGAFAHLVLPHLRRHAEANLRRAPP